MTSQGLNPHGFTRTCADLTPESFAAGRRPYFAARDLLVAQATGGEFGMAHAKLTGEGRSTGWHYHPVSLQVIYVLKGWIDLVFEDGQTIRAGAGACMNIPPGMIHNEIGMSDDYEVIEFCSPAGITTVNVDAPTALTATFGTL